MKVPQTGTEALVNEPKDQVLQVPARESSLDFVAGLGGGFCLLGLRLTRTVVIVIVRVLAIQFTASSSVDHNAKHVVFAQRLKRTSYGVERGGTNSNHQYCAVAHRCQQVSIGCEKQRWTVKDDPIKILA